MALAGKIDNKDYKVYVLIGDGESQEGAVWEAAMAAAHHKLDNLVVILDKNQVQETGKTKDVMNIDPAADKWNSFGFEVFEIDGHNIAEIINALDNADKPMGKPVMIVANTIKGKGVSFMELNYKFHGKAPDDEQFKQAMQELAKNS